MRKTRGLLSCISPVMLIVATILFIALAPFCSRWYEFAGAGLLVVVLSVLAGTGWRFWGRYLKISLPLIILSVFFNWALNLPDGIKTLWSSSALFTNPANLQSFFQATAIGVRFGLAIFFSLLLVHVCTHRELVWGLAKLSGKLFRRPVIGEVLALALLSVPFFLQSLSGVRRWKDIPDAIAGVFHEARSIVSHPVEITGKRPGWLLLSTGVLLLATAVAL